MVLFNSILEIENQLDAMIQLIPRIFENELYLEKIDEFLYEKEAMIYGKGKADIDKIVLKDVCFKYTTAHLEILHDINMKVERGKKIAIIGKNGAGKSTTFKAILGLISIDGGAITLLGKEIENFTAKDKEALGVVLSDSGFSGYLTIRDIVPVLEHLYHKFDKYFFLEQVKKYNLPLNKKIKEFSTGMKAKLKVLVAISHHAKLLILDEPTAGLDVIARDELLELLREFMEKDEDRAILISSHISSDLETLCDDLYMIHDGKIILHEDTDVLLGDYALLKLDDTQYHALDKQYLLRSKK